MIVSHKHKFIYIKPRKTAGSSIEMMLSRICGPDDIITRLGKEDEIRQRENIGQARNYYLPLKYYGKLEMLRTLLGGGRLIYHEHFSAAEIAHRIAPEIWKSYFKFTFDRNPFDKAVSYYYWAEGDKTHGSIKKWIDDGGLYAMSSYNLYSIGNRVAVDKIYRYEDMSAGLADLTEQLGLKKPLMLPTYKAKSTYRKVADYRAIIDPETEQLLRVMYAREIALLGYDF